MSVLASIPLAISVSLHGFFSSSEEFSAVKVILATALVVLYAGITSAAYAFLFGCRSMPSPLARMNASPHNHRRRDRQRRALSRFVSW